VQITMLLADENVSAKGEFHSYHCGPRGYSDPASLEPDKMRSLIDTYREAWRAAGHPGTARPLRWPLHGARPVAIASSRVGAHMKNVFMIWPLRGDGCAARKTWPLQKSRCRDFKLTHYPVMNRIDPELFNACFSSWLAEC
jgi:hypothetical protein